MRNKTLIMESGTGALVPGSLVRGIRRWDLVALVINMMIGAGIFGLPAKVYALTGAYSLWAYLLCGLLALLVILCFAEVGSRFAETGGTYLHAREAFGPFAAFQVGWMMWVARVTSFAAIANILIGYLGYFWPAAGSPTGRTFVITATIGLLTIVNVVGVRHSSILGNVLTVGKLLPLLVFVGAGSFFIDGANFSFQTAPDHASFSKAVLLLVFAFSGFENAAIPAGESQDPKRHLPFAFLLAIGFVVLLYMLIQAVCIGTLPSLGASQRPLADAAAFLGPWGGAFIAAGAMISVSGTMHSGTLAAPRILYAMAEAGQLPRVLASVHGLFRTPHMAILATSAVSLTLALSWNFIHAVTISTLIRLITYMVTCAALPVLRRRSAPGFRAPVGPVVATCAIGLCVWLLSNSSWKEFRDVAAVAALGLIFHFVRKRFADGGGQGKPATLAS